MKCWYFRQWALYGIKPVPTKPSVRRYWWPSVNSVTVQHASLVQILERLEQEFQVEFCIFVFTSIRRNHIRVDPRTLLVPIVVLSVAPRTFQPASHITHRLAVKPRTVPRTLPPRSLPLPAPGPHGQGYQLAGSPVSCRQLEADVH